MSTTRTKRKLVARNHLIEITASYKLDVPLAKLVKRVGNKITAPTLRRLLQAHALLLVAITKGTPEEREIIENSLYPCWLEDVDDPRQAVQQCPNGITYLGICPLGKGLEDGTHN